MSMALSQLTEFRAVYCSGAFIPDPDAVVALALLFQKIYLPNNIEFVRTFAAKYRMRTATIDDRPTRLKVKSETEEDPFSDLSPEQQETARCYLLCALQFAHRNSQLFGEVFESELLPDNEIVNVELIKKGGAGELNTYRVSSNIAVLTGGEMERFPRSLSVIALFREQQALWSSSGAEDLLMTWVFGTIPCR